MPVSVRLGICLITFERVRGKLLEIRRNPQSQGLVPLMPAKEPSVPRLMSKMRSDSLFFRPLEEKRPFRSHSSIPRLPQEDAGANPSLHCLFVVSN